VTLNSLLAILAVNAIPAVSAALQIQNKVIEK